MKENDTLRAEVAALKQSRDLSEVHVISELQAEVERLKGTGGRFLVHNGLSVFQGDVDHLYAKNTELRARVVELEQDKERLDWIESCRLDDYFTHLSVDHRANILGWRAPDVHGGSYPTLREAIDAARTSRPGIQEWHGENERHGPPHKVKP